MKEKLITLAYALLLVVVILLAPYLQSLANEDMVRRAEAYENGWCNINYETSKATIPYKRISRIEASL